MGITDKQYGRKAGVKGVTVVPVSFETNAIGAYKIPFVFPVKVTNVNACVGLLIEATNNGTITPSNSVGNMTGAALTLTGGSTTGTEFSGVPTANYTIAAGTDLTLTTAKVTAGGTAVVTVHWVTV